MYSAVAPGQIQIKLNKVSLDFSDNSDKYIGIKNWVKVFCELVAFVYLLFIISILTG